MRFKRLLCLGGLLVGVATTAHAENEDVTVACSTGSNRPSVRELGIRAAHNEFALANQDLVTGAGTYSWCVNDTTRVRLEGAGTFVDEEGRNSQAIVFGLSLPRDLWKHAALTPSVYLGYENLHNGNDQVVTAAALTFEQQFLLNEDKDVRFTLGLRPEYANRTATNDARPDGGDALNVTGFARYSAPLGSDKWRLRATGAYVDVGGRSSIDHISSFGLGIGATDGGWYKWVADLTYRRGNANYEGILFSLTFVDRTYRN